MLHLITNNGGFFTEPTIEVDTIDLKVDHFGCRYETALRTQGGIEELERYETMAQAVEGHQRWARKYDCRNNVSL